MNKDYYKILNMFANDSPLATNIKVDITGTHKSFKPRFKDSKAYYEDANLLSTIITGAENFCWWLERNGFKIVKKGSAK